MTGSILIGIDSSTPSRSALAWAIRRAVATGASIEMLHVIDTESIEHESAEWHALRETAADLLRRELTFARTLAPQLQITTVVTDGRAEDALARRSSHHAMLVVGTHKTGFIYGQTFGSRFLGLAWRAHCDVAFIPDQVGTTRRGVVAAAESTPVGVAVVRFAAAEAAASAQDLMLIGATRAAAERSAVIAHEGNEALRISCRASELPRAEALIAASALAALLVIGRPSHPWSSTQARGLNHDVLLNMACPVVVISAD